MKWSWRLGAVAGIDVYLHATFLLLLAWVGMSHWLASHTLAAAVEGVAFILALFACVLLHEFGHALTARRYGIKTRDITLLPIGGLARLEHMPDDPKQELWVAMAGPAVNVVIVALLFTWLGLTSGLQPFAALSVTSGPFLERLMVVNVFLVLFNLVPAFPMDGGRVLRALLAMRLEYTRATQLAAGLGQALALLFGFVGLFSNPFLVFIALFVWMGAEQEASLAQMRSALGGIPVSKAMLTDFRSLSANDRVADAIKLTLAGTQRDFPVRDNGRVIGVLPQAELFAVLAQEGEHGAVTDAMRRDFQVVDALEMLDTAFERLQNSECRTMPVMHNNRLVGLLTMENVGEFLQVQAATARRRLPPQSSA